MLVYLPLSSCRSKSCVHLLRSYHNDAFSQQGQGLVVTFEKDKDLEDWVKVGMDLARGMDTQGLWSQLSKTPEPYGTSTISSLEKGLGEQEWEEDSSGLASISC